MLVISRENDPWMLIHLLLYFKRHFSVVFLFSRENGFVIRFSRHNFTSCCTDHFIVKLKEKNQHKNKSSNPDLFDLLKVNMQVRNMFVLL